MIVPGKSGFEAQIVFTLTNDSGPIVAHSWVTGQLLLSLPGTTAFVNANVANIVHRGGKTYALELTALQTSAEGAVAIRTAVPTAYENNQIFSDYVGQQTPGSEIEVLFTLTDGGTGSPIAGKSWAGPTTPELQIALPGTGFSDANSSWIYERGSGVYACAIPPSNTLIAGKILLRTNVTNAWENNSAFWADISDVPTGGGGPGESIPPSITYSYPTRPIDPVIVQIADGSGLRGYVVYCQLDQGFSFMIYDDDLGFYPYFDRGSSATGLGTLGNPRVLTIYRYGGWPTNAQIKIKVKAVDIYGNEAVA